MLGPDQQELRHSPNPITFEVSKLGEPHDESWTITYPSYIDIPYVHWGVLHLRPGLFVREEFQEESHNRQLRFGRDGLIGVLFMDPGLGVDLAELPLDDDLPSVDEFEAFFTEHDIFLGRKTEEQIKQEFDERSLRWVQETAESRDTAFEQPDYKAIVALGDAVIPLILQRYKNAPEDWNFALKHLTSNDPTADEWNPFGERWELAPADESRSAWLKWGEEKGFLQQPSLVE